MKSFKTFSEEVHSVHVNRTVAGTPARGYDAKKSQALAKKHKATNHDSDLRDTGKGENYTFNKKEHAHAFSKSLNGHNIPHGSVQSS